MPIDPAIEAMLESARPRRQVPIREVPVEDMRAGYRARYRERSTVPASHVDRQEFTIGEGDAAFQLVLYRPQEASAPLPLVVYFHGGGYVLGDDAAYERQSRNLSAACGCAILFVDYRKAPEWPFPAALDDSIAATRWALSNTDRIGVDPARVVLMGDSAGGNLAINVARRLCCEAPGLFRLLCLLYPVTDFRPYFGRVPSYLSDEEFAVGKGLDFDHMRFFGEQYLGDGALSDDAGASPILATDLSALPDTLIFAARNDVLHDQGKAFAGHLALQGVRVTYICFETMIHNFMGHTAVSGDAEAAFHEVAGMLARRLRA